MHDENLDQPSKNLVWQWHFPISPGDQRRRLLTVGGLLGAGLLCFALAALSVTRGSSDNSRFTIVLGMLFLGLLALGEMETKRARSTIISLNRMGLLTFADSRSTSSVDLRSCSTPNVRRRSSPTRWHWSLEASTPDAGWHRELANTSSYFQLSETDAMALEAELQHWSSWARSGLSPTQSPQAPTAAATPATISMPISSTVPPMATSSQFHWTPPRHLNASRNRRRLRLGTVGLAFLVAVVATITEWENGLAAVGFSMLTPVIILLVGAGLDLLFRSGQKFSIDIKDGLLTINRGRGEPVIVPIHTIRSLSVDSATSSVNTGTTTQRTMIWKLSIHSDQDPSKPDPTLAVIPTGFGSGFNTDEAIKLESGLRGFLSQL